MKAFRPDLDKALGIFIPLIVVNCIILGRAEAFAYRNPPLPSLLDGLGMGIGFGLALLILGTIREILGAGKFLGIPITKAFSNAQEALMEPWGLFVLPPGAFIVLGLVLAARQAVSNRLKGSSKSLQESKASEERTQEES